MHELALARSLVELVEDYASEHDAVKVRQVNLRLGEMSAMARALHFCFDSVARNTVCEGARLRIEEVPLTVHCDCCDEVKQPSGRYNFRCPDCGMPTPKLVSGREMQLVSIELMENHESACARKRETLYQTA
ncbi:MAG: hydrogenase maturation nickel metallochaperone HypA [Acidiferrobacterales bacterium]|nr:hydrogenase maturation nickel metallochaperone HypA [Acidiferrobacterales bacterium]